MIRWLTQFFCHHDYRFEFGKKVLSLRCAHCGRCTNGWNLQ